jgi:hypothetical protein
MSSVIMAATPVHTTGVNVESVIAIVGSIAVILGFCTAVLGFFNQQGARKALEAAEATNQKVQEISVNVDGRLSALIDRQGQLLGALHEYQVPIPPVPPPQPFDQPPSPVQPPPPA